jgi:hypothetical protein
MAYSTPTIGGGGSPTSAFDPADIKSLFDDFGTELNSLDADNFAKTTGLTHRELHPGSLTQTYVATGSGTPLAFVVTIPGTATASPFPSYPNVFDVSDTGLSFFQPVAVDCAYQCSVEIQKARTVGGADNLKGLFADSLVTDITLRADLYVYVNGTAVNQLTTASWNDTVGDEYRGATLQSQGVVTLAAGLNTIHAELNFSNTTTNTTPTDKDDYFMEFLVLGRMTRAHVIRR